MWQGCGGECGGLSRSKNLIEKLNGEIFYVWEGGNLNERNSPLCRQVEGKYVSNGPFIPLLTEEGWLTWPTKEQFWKKRSCEKKLEWWGKIKRRGKLTAAALCRQVTGRYGSHGPLIPLLTEGGRQAWPTKRNLIGKKKLLEKIGMVGGKQKGEANSPSMPSP